MNSEKVLSEVVNNTSSEVILLFVIIAVVLLVLAIPIYRMASENSRKGKDQEIREQQLLIDVIKGNSEVMGQLKTVLESTHSNCANCKASQLAKFKDIVDKQNSNTVVLTRIEDMIKTII